MGFSCTQKFHLTHLDTQEHCNKMAWGGTVFLVHYSINVKNMHSHRDSNTGPWKAAPINISI